MWLHLDIDHHPFLNNFMKKVVLCFYCKKNINGPTFHKKTFFLKLFIMLAKNTSTYSFGRCRWPIQIKMGNLNFLIVLVVVSCFCATTAYIVDENPYRHWVTLDPQGKYRLEWLADWETKRVTFNVTVETKGWVGFGLARKGRMPGADLIIGGVNPDGSTYFADRYSIGNSLPEIDPSQDWKLHDAWERGNITFLSFSRAFDTCDEDHDLPINNDLSSLIWAHSEVDDDIQYHYQHRGSYDVYLLDPDLVPRGIEEVSTGRRMPQEDVKIHRLAPKITLRTQDTQYWCTFHKLPMRRKQHVIGFQTVFPTPNDRRHVHHILLHRCRSPPGVSPDAFFGDAMRSEGSECYILDRPNPLPVPYCRETIHIWGVGGRAIFLPEHAGIPIVQNADDEYLMMQVHYDNPDLTNDNVTVSLELYHTDKIREHDVGVLQFGAVQPGSTTILIPPSDPGHVVTGHCSPGCTQRMLGDVGGANVFAILLHTHQTGRGVRVLHLRDGKELPWLLNDDQYNFDYQQFRILREEKKIEPGDLVIQRCVYDNTDRNGSATTGGFSTREEMCTTFMYYYNHSPGFALCRGEIMTRRYFDFLGIQNVTWDQSVRQTHVTGPPQVAGLTMLEYANTQMTWNLETRKELQRLQIYETQTAQCPRNYWVDRRFQLETQVRDFGRTGRMPGSDGRDYTSVDEDFAHESQYPQDIARWKPEQQCSKRKESGIDEH